MTDDFVPAEVMDERLQRLQSAIARDQAAFNAGTLGKSCAVLIERKGKLPGQMLGKSPWLQSVHLMTDAQIGDLIEVEIVRADPNSLAGVERVRAAA
jgi:tRNA-2-methylthio-N6-dimethylallyladenosine synthase